MKKMTNKWWLVLSALAVLVAPALVSCDDDEKEVIKEVIKEVNVQIPGMDISKFTIGANGGENIVGITPSDNWKMVSKTDWLTITPAEGTTANTEVTLTAEANTGFGSRPAIVEVTVGDTTMTKTVMQEGIQRSITIFGDTIFFSAKETEFRVSPIVANVEVTVEKGKLPAWVKDVVLSLNQDGYYEAVVTLNTKDYDSEKRYGEIIFKDADSDYAVAFPVVCTETKMGPRGYATNMTKITIEGEGDDFLLDVLLSPDSPEDTVLAYIYGGIRYESLYDPMSRKNALTVTPAASPAVALNRHSWNIHVEAWNAVSGGPTRSFYVFVVPKEEAADFNPNQQISGTNYEPNLIITQKTNNMVKKVIRVEGSIREGNTIKVKLHRDYASGVKMVISSEIAMWEDDPFGSGFAELFDIQVEQQGAEMEEEYIVYTYKITYIQSGASGWYFYAMALDANGNYVRDNGDAIYAMDSSGYDIVVN